MKIKTKLGIVLYVFICTIIILTKESYCYLDPSAMTYMIQIVSAIFITIGSGIGIFFYKIKRHLRKRKEANNNLENKEVEINEEK